MRRPLTSLSFATFLGVGAFAGFAAPAAVAATPTVSDAHVKLVQAGDRICTETALILEPKLASFETVKISGFRQKKGHRALPARAEQFIRQMAIPETNKALVQLRALTAPPEDTAAYKDLLATAQGELDSLAKGKIELYSGDPMANSAKKFKAFGFTQCGSSHRPSESTAKK